MKKLFYPICCLIMLFIGCKKSDTTPMSHFSFGSNSYNSIFSVKYEDTTSTLLPYGLLSFLTSISSQNSCTVSFIFKKLPTISSIYKVNSFQTNESVMITVNKTTNGNEVLYSSANSNETINASISSNLITISCPSTITVYDSAANPLSLKINSLTETK